MASRDSKTRADLLTLDLKPPKKGSKTIAAGALAVHCKAGLGRTGVLICAYLIKHHGFSAEEAIGYIRVCRPGSVIGPQQNYLLSKAKQLAQEGKAFQDAKKVRQQSHLTPPWPAGVNFSSW